MKKIPVTIIVFGLLIISVIISRYISDDKPANQIHALKPLVQQIEDNSPNTEYKKTQSQYVETDKAPTELTTLPTILKGTHPDGYYNFDSEGRLIISSSIKNRFDYYLSAVSEVGIENCIKLIEEDIKNMLPEKAAKEALKILTLYISYKKSIQNSSAINTGLPDTVEKLAILQKEVAYRKKMRRQHFSPEIVEAFFGESERYDDYSLRRLALNQTKFSGNVEKNEQLKKIEKTLDEAVRRRHEKYRHINELAQKQ